MRDERIWSKVDRVLQKGKLQKKSHTHYTLAQACPPVPSSQAEWGGEGGIVTAAFFFLLLNYSLAKGFSDIDIRYYLLLITYYLLLISCYIKSL